ncbi:MAG: hypothetical protein ACTJHT_11600 [Sphingobacterium sp.]|uniref:hypothetical protein n=1 Tax=Sphingobacterium sp. JB170 TaxID=1434842 RepID=UPI00097EDA2D|nr:hypothetical protein [Sphingobacterium sp. JB170]SJN49480.1 hypothetical protein FM107_18785 [Sphingobacterium sp. JB170]
MFKYLVFCFFTMLLVCCKISDGTGVIDAVQYDSADSTVLSLKEGQAHILPTSGVRIAVKRVLEDSRCPKGVHCIWAGVGLVEIELTAEDGETSLDTLSTSQVAKMGYSRSTVFANHRIKLETLNPYPVSEKPSLNPVTYIVLISVLK